MPSRRFTWIAAFFALAAMAVGLQGAGSIGGASGLSLINAAEARQTEGGGGVVIRRRFVLLPGIRQYRVRDTLEDISRALNNGARVSLLVRGLSSQQTRLLVRMQEKVGSEDATNLFAEQIIWFALQNDVNHRKQRDRLKIKVDSQVEFVRKLVVDAGERIARATAEARPEDLNDALILFHFFTVQLHLLKEFRNTID